MGADVYQADNDGNTALHIAVLQGNEEAAIIFLETTYK